MHLPLSESSQAALLTKTQYLLDSLSKAADLALLNCINFADLENLVDFANALQDRGQGQVSNLFALTVIRLGSSLRELLGMEEAWFTLHASADLQKLVFEYHMIVDHSQRLVKWFGEKTGCLWSEFEAPAYRSKWYNETWGTVGMELLAL